MENPTRGPVYSIVVPVYDEEETLPTFYERLDKLFHQLDGEAEIIFVDDGSRDRSFSILSALQAKDPRVRVARLSRNFGHQTATTAGLDLASGQAVVIMDADLQDPPEVVMEMVEQWRKGYDIVYGVRENREGESWFKRTTANWFYRLLRKLTDVDIPLDVGDFRLMNRKAMNALLGLRENSRFLRGMISWTGFKQIGVRYVRASRHAGMTKYPLRKMLKLATDAVLSFSNIPLRLTLAAGFLVSALAFVAGFVTIILKISGVYTVPGWASLAVVISFLGGIQLTVVGIGFEYVGRIYEEVKNRPLYIVSDLLGFPANVIERSRAVISVSNLPLLEFQSSHANPEKRLS